MNIQNRIVVEVIVCSPIDRVWEFWTKPEHIVNWAFASDTWEAPASENNLIVGGKFKTVMAAKDGSVSFDFTGTYKDIREHELIEYDMDADSTLADGLEGKSRHVKTEFSVVPEGVKITQSFDPEKMNSEEMQRAGWQTILDNFKKYTESNN